jgi:cysteine-rich repeat protein
MKTLRSPWLTRSFLALSFAGLGCANKIDATGLDDDAEDSATTADTSPAPTDASRDDATSDTAVPVRDATPDVVVPAGCGNGTVDPGEECDDGKNVAGSGCEPTCRYTCHDAADCAVVGSCVQGRTCDGSHRCTTGSPVPAFSPCTRDDGTPGVCDGTTCVKAGCEPPVKCGVGACARTGTTCSSDSCKPGAPVAETCNAIDDDCDGYVDDGLLASTCGLGICASRGTTCAASSCTPGAPRTETCDGLDEDCDGVVDDGVTRDCYDFVPETTKGVGVCHGGKQSCVAGGGGAWGTTCTGEVGPTSAFQTVADPGTSSFDFDCNGKIEPQHEGSAACNDGLLGCSLKQPGWIGPAPACGASGAYTDSGGSCARPSGGGACAPVPSRTVTQGCR